MTDEYIKSIEKLANGYEYEEIQTLIEETSSGTKKKIIKTKKHIPPNFQAARYMLNKSNKFDYAPSGEIETFKKEVF